MKGRVWKIFILITCLILAMSMLVGCAKGCTEDTPPAKYEDREVGDFVVRFYEDYCEIKGTTEQGNNQRFLVIPEYIDGVRVESLGVKGFTFYAHGLRPPETESDKLEKVYFETTTKVHPYSFEYRCPNFKKVLYPGIEESPYCFDNRPIVYYPRSIYENKEQISGLPIHLKPRSPANVTYNYNYEDSEKDGYYWIDDCDYGSKIEYIPKDPTREGYTFGGWYQETECINIWNFATNNLPEKITELKENFVGKLEEVTVYQETILYANWIKS